HRRERPSSPGVWRPSSREAMPPSALPERGSYEREGASRSSCWLLRVRRRHPDSNRGITDLQSVALPLGYAAEEGAILAPGSGGSNVHASWDAVERHRAAAWEERDLAVLPAVVRAEGRDEGQQLLAG